MTTLKTCFKCKTEKPRSEFYKHPAMGDGLLGKCKECAKRDVREHRTTHDSVREYDRLRAVAPHRRLLASRVQKQYRAEHPERKQAQAIFRYALLQGKVKPMPCWVCGSKAEAHHPDYSAPLDVVWLCTRHHRAAHQAAA